MIDETTGRDTFILERGRGPLLVTVPHAGTELPDSLRARLTESARLLPDTDWFVDSLYRFVPGLGQTLLVARSSRYLIDLNRPTDDHSLYPGQATTGLCPTEQFGGSPIYSSGEEPDALEIRSRIETAWQPFHTQIRAELDRIQAVHGYAVLLDGHSIASRVPRLFEGTLADLNLGTVHGASTDPGIEELVAAVLNESQYSVAINGRFVGGAITRSYGRPRQGVHALQIEMGWDAYLSDGAWDQVKAESLRALLERVVQALIRWRPRQA